jgi:CHAT domain-containing protein
MSAEEAMKEQDLTTDLTILNAMLIAEKANPNPTRAKELTAQVQNARMELEAFQANLYATHPILKTQRAEITSIDAEKIGTLVDPNSVILEYSVSKEQTFLFIWTSEQNLNVIRIPIKQETLAELTKGYRQQLGKRDLRASQTGEKLYKILLHPAENYFRGKRKLIIVPDRELWELPFQALQQTNGQSVLERFSVSYASSLSVLYEMKKQKQNVDAPAGLLALASSIPATEKEVQTLAQFYRKQESRVYTGRKAQERVLKKEAAAFDVIHVAAHGVLDNASPMYSYLKLANDENEDGLLEPREVMNLDLHTSLVVLSACETGGGKIGTGEGMIGFTWAFFVAGSPSTVASQWKVDSESTATLMSEFHRNLKVKKLSKSEALRQAALKLRENPEYRHPYYWAGFIVVGDPSPI